MTNINIDGSNYKVELGERLIDIDLGGKPETIFNPVGGRGAGEIGVTGIPAAIADAVYNATGRRVRDFPITLDKLIVWPHSLVRSADKLSENSRPN